VLNFNCHEETNIIQLSLADSSISKRPDCFPKKFWRNKHK
jgi:hypothetical protein